MTHILANVGDAGFTLPIAIALAMWIATSRWQLALRWILTLGVGMCFVGATKIIHAGWGAEIEPIGFRMVSGHTMLATAILTVVLALLSDRLELGKGLGIAAGLAIGAITAAARVVDHSHSLAEVISGWIVGATVALLFLRAYARSDARPRYPMGAVVGFLVVAMLAYGHRAPFEMMIDIHSPALRALVGAELTRFF
ncbi:PA-phosphatase-like phosphoesterase [Caballeronia arationis]|jgi:membrane-associated phospholipid phosphatase|uniref:PAP2 superfamily protein n=1 Tax=Caballeronia arationis TaxID=1777142 RepID=A0A7Z7IF31_9BURK|nr:phosphatase PAP2 family protein [Caballeronia arationis]SAL05112.1 PA-phosphatase-like phosphoesterase [Caballeronia arationis]SOE88686.1 PAP2 superfamily protein [Caballeronia arationis]